MSLADTQKLALERLQALLNFETTGIRKVEVEATEQLNALPLLVIFDDGMTEERPGNSRRIVTWDLHFQVFCAKASLRAAYQQALAIRANMIDRLGDDITLGGSVSNTAWREHLSIVELQDGEEKYAGVDGVYVLHIWDARTFS